MRNVEELDIEVNSLVGLGVELYREFAAEKNIVFDRCFNALLDLGKLSHQCVSSLTENPSGSHIKSLLNKVLEVGYYLKLINNRQLLRGNFDFVIRQNDKIISILKKELISQSKLAISS